MSFGEVVLISIVAIVVVGPRNLPQMMRRAGVWIGRLRRMAVDLRQQSGIDEILAAEGLHDEIAQFRALARGELMSVQSALKAEMDAIAAPEAPPPKVDRGREWPVEGADAYGAPPDDLDAYAPAEPTAEPPAEVVATRPPSALARPDAPPAAES